MKKTTLDIIKEVAKEHLKEYLGPQRHHPKGNLGKLEDRQRVASQRTQRPLGLLAIRRYRNNIQEDDEIIINPDDKNLSSVPAIKSNNKKEYQK